MTPGLLRTFGVMYDNTFPKLANHHTQRTNIKRAVSLVITVTLIFIKGNQMDGNLVCEKS